MGSDASLIVVVALAFVLAVFLAAAETAVIRVPSVRARSLAAEGGVRARILSSLLGRLPEVLNAILLAALLSQITAATTVGILAGRWFGSTGPAVASAVLTFLLYVYAEAIPKTYAVRHPDRVALALAIPVRALELVLRPVVRVLIWLADLQMPGKGVITSPTITEDELRMLASKAATEGQITSDDAHLIERVFRVGDLQVDDIMVPRTDIVAVEEETHARDALEIALEAGHRRLPVFRGSIEEITGVVRLRDLVRVPAGRRDELPVVRIAEDPLVVPQFKRVLELLQEMQASGPHLAVVVDEYGGTAGIVTVEDIAEELLGTISEDSAEPDVVDLGDGRWRIAGTVPVEDLAEIVGSEVEDDDWNTAAGLVLGLAGHIPTLGEEVRHRGHALRVVAMRGRRITRIEVRRLPRPGRGGG